jgi:hypothetical protein
VEGWQTCATHGDIWAVCTQQEPMENNSAHSTEWVCTAAQPSGRQSSAGQHGTASHCQTIGFSHSDECGPSGRHTS